MQEFLNCLRCPACPLNQLASVEEEEDISFFECPDCLRQYTLHEGKQLTYRWRHPISLALYGVIFNDNPLTEALRIAKSLNSTISILYLSEFIEEIRLELDYPTQQVRNILENIATEDACRIFLREVVFQMAQHAKFRLAISNMQIVAKLRKLVSRHRRRLV